MARRLVIVLLGVGAVLGFGFGIARLSYGYHFGHYGYGSQRAEFEAHIAEVCTKAASKVFAEQDGTQKAK